jgi:hypothetical protein
MRLIDIYDHVCWNESTYSIIEDKLLDIETDCPTVWKEIKSLEMILQAVAIGKINARETRRSIKRQATQILED